MIHELKTWPKYFKRVYVGDKKFEVRKNDRDYQIGDFLKLKEFDFETKEYSGNELLVRITNLLNGGDFGIQDGYCVMSIVIAL